VTGLVFGGLRVADAVSTSDSYGRTAQLATLGAQATTLAQALENERDLSAGASAYTLLSVEAAKTPSTVTKPLAAGQASEQASLKAAENTTDAAAQQARTLAAAIGTAFPATTQAKAESVVQMIDSIPGLRTEAVGESAAQIIDNYSTSVADLFVLNDEITSGSGDALLSDEVRALGAVSRAKDEASQQRALLYDALIEVSVPDAVTDKTVGTVLAGTPVNTYPVTQALADAGELGTLTTAQGLQFADITDFNDAATPDQVNAYQLAVGGPQADEAQLIDGFVALNGDPRLTFERIGQHDSLRLPQATVASIWYSDMSAQISEMRQIETQVMASIVSRGQTLQNAASNSALLTAVVTLAAVLLVLLATALVGRTLVNPLRRLQEDALEIAAVRLPSRVAAAAAGTEPGEEPEPIEPIGVSSTDEIGMVARAFDQVHAEAVRLAGNEAQLRGSLNAMFISLSRRSVPLIDRLSRMIDAMEQTEDDPDQLANLFSMDHLVTRMRRNSENLLVLAGEEPVRKWTESVPLADVTRAAAAEIEQYGRVALTVQPGVMVSGQAAADVVHLLAELIENATLFSPQSSQVRVTVMELSTGGILVEVRDDGVGVSANRLADMNWRLDNPPALDVSISRHMGLYAVAHLAARHGIRVKLRPGVPQGLSALVWLPGSLARQERVPAGGNRAPHVSGGTAPMSVMGNAPLGAVDAAPFGSQALGAGDTQPFGGEGSRPLTTGRPATLARQAAGRHRGASVSGGQPLLTGRGGKVAQPSTVWFAAKRPSSGLARSADELAASWQPTTSGRVPGAGPAGYAMSGGQAGGPGHAGQTSAGLPRRAPRTGTQPGADVPDWGPDARGGFGTRTQDATLLGAPDGGQTTPLPTRFAAPPPTPYTAPPPTPYQEASAQGAPYPESSRGEQVLSRRRSPEAVRSRLSGFQLGSRDAVPPGQEPRQAPPAGEENSR
jgi:signal transduction histidine kinase